MLWLAFFPWRSEFWAATLAGGWIKPGGFSLGWAVVSRVFPKWVWCGELRVQVDFDDGSSGLVLLRVFWLIVGVVRVES